MEIEHLKTFKLGEWIVEPSSGTLRKGDELVHLAPKVMDLLLLLARRQGEVVTKEELISTIWPDTFVAETALTRSISELRHSLADSTGSPTYIETIPKRGYRFLVEAEEIKRSDGIKYWKKPVAVVAAFSVLLLLAAAYFIFSWEGDGLSMSAQRGQNLVVLPFNRSGLDPASNDLAIGATEIIIEYLSRFESLNVASGTSLTHFEHNTRDLRKIADRLGVPNLLEGSYRGKGEGAVVSLKLSDTRTHELLWSGEFDLDSSNIELMAAEISREVAALLGASMDSDGGEVYAGRTSDNFEALQYRLMADHFRNQVPDSLEMAARYYQMALEKRPAYAPAHAGLAITYMGLGSWVADPAWGHKAQEAMSRALALNSEIPESNIANGIYLRIYRKDFLAAELALKEAVRLDPYHSNARREYGLLLMRDLGRPDEALFQLTEASRLDPLMERNYVHLFELYCNRGEYLEAVRIAKRQLELNPVNPLAYRNIAQAYLLLGKIEEAVNWGRRSMDLYGYSEKDIYIGRTFELLAILYLDRGEIDKAAEIGRQMDSVDPGSPSSITIQGLMALYQGDYQGASSFFRRVLELHPNQDIWTTGVRVSTYLAYSLLKAGDHAGAREALDRSTQRNRETNFTAYEKNSWPPLIFQDELAVYILQDEKDEALKYLDELIENGWKAYHLIGMDPVFETVRADPEFESLCSLVKPQVESLHLQVELEGLTLR